VFEEKNVTLNTPTGSGKSLVATALHFQAIAKGKRSIYTCPIKALVNEKFMALCREFGPDNVGLSTGDASVTPADDRKSRRVQQMLVDPEGEMTGSPNSRSISPNHGSRVILFYACDELEV
jgi:ATP-dependent helicase YprA (DUF1998 family)